MKEFQLIRQIQQQTAVAFASESEHGVKLGIGDDAAVLELPAGRHLVAATDTLNAGVHFPVDTTPADIGHKALAVNLSDLAAMGAVPRWALLSLSLPDANPQWVESFASGFQSLAQAHGVSLVGGDTTSGPLSVSLTALGYIQPGRQLTRGGAKPGDLLVVSGSIGGAARELDLLQAGEQVNGTTLLDRPVPRVKLGQALVDYASACIDVSDGLLADLGHVIKASGCGARVELEALPFANVLDGLDDELKWKYQLSGGDDYELLFALPKVHKALLKTWSQQFDISLSVIGSFEAGEDIRCLAADGNVYNPQSRGFEHFRHKP